MIGYWYSQDLSDPSELKDVLKSLVDVSDYASASFSGETVDECSGYSVSKAGDINNDGYDDILIGASYGKKSFESKAYVIFGRETDRWVMDQSLSEANLTIRGNQYTGTNSRFATDVSGIGDINNDGYADFSISAPWINYRRGLIFVIFGKSSWESSLTTTTTPETPTFPSFVMLSSIVCLIIFLRRNKSKIS